MSSCTATGRASSVGRRRWLVLAGGLGLRDKQYDMGASTIPSVQEHMSFTTTFCLDASHIAMLPRLMSSC